MCVTNARARDADAGRRFRRSGFARANAAATSIEYSVMAALIALALVTGGSVLSYSLNTVFEEILIALTPEPPMVQMGGH